MIKNYVFLLIVFLSGSVCARSTCAEIPGQQSYQPLTIKNGTICFVQEAVLDPKTRAPINATAISLYYIYDEAAPLKAEGRGLLYAGTPGEVVDAFSAPVGRDRRKKVFVIHSIDVRKSLVEPNSSGKFYSVSVFDPVGIVLRRDERASEWFGADYSWLSNGRKILYKFPYLSREAVQQALDSPFAMLMINGEQIPARLKTKSYLFEGPNLSDKSVEYLIEGDRVVVAKATAGWCQVSYTGGAKALQMWMMCSALRSDTQAAGKLSIESL